MKPKIKYLFLAASIAAFTSSAISAQTKNDPSGRWDAYIPFAPEEFQRSVVKITHDSVYMSGDGVHFAPAVSMKFRNDTLSYKMNEGSITLVFENSTKMRGFARWESGQSEMILTKKEDAETGKK